MIRYKNRPVSSISPATAREEAWYKITTELGDETVSESELQFDTKADIKKFNEDYKTSVSEENVVTLDEQAKKDLEETDRLREEANKTSKEQVTEIKPQDKPKNVAEVKTNEVKKV